MRKSSFLLSVFILASSIAFGQGKNPFHQTGSPAILFSFNGLSSLSASSYGGGIGGKYFINPNTTLRGSLIFTNSKLTDTYDGSSPTGVDGYEKATQLGISVAVEVHPKIGRTSPYFGGGIGFSSTSTEEKNTASNKQDQSTRKNYSVSTPAGTFFGNSTFNIFGILGIEFFVTKEISLAAEYHAGLSKHSFKDREETYSNTTTTYKGGSATVFGINTAGFITLAIYF